MINIINKQRVITIISKWKYKQIGSFVFWKASRPTVFSCSLSNKLLNLVFLNDYLQIKKQLTS